MMKKRTHKERALGAHSYLDLRGRTWEMTPLSQKDLADATAYMRSRETSPLEELRDDPAFKDFPIEIQIEMGREAVRLKEARNNDMLRASSLGSFIEGDGLVFLLWKSVKRNHKEVGSVDDFFKLFHNDEDEMDLDPMEMKEIGDKLDEASGWTQTAGNLPRRRDSVKNRRRKKKNKDERKRKKTTRGGGTS